MPGMNGHQLVTIFRNERPGIRTMLMSGYPNHVAARNGYIEPGIAFINKPFSPITIANKIRAVLDEGLMEDKTRQ
jgi:two-component system cell cycle sensor histidine kinase/response regulator CckA